MRYNNALARLRHMFDVAKDTGITYTNPAETLGAGAGARARPPTRGNGGHHFAAAMRDMAKD
ncbi:MAG: hypothetical protein DME58_11630 [Verrucomicrobia bacterium]|nr:MAG: hypothetical protein DME58_11630 [Verrucomicrobiota bacterium]